MWEIKAKLQYPERKGQKDIFYEFTTSETDYDQAVIKSFKSVQRELEVQGVSDDERVILTVIDRKELDDYEWLTRLSMGSMDCPWGTLKHRCIK